MKALDLVGQRFGRLTVLSRGPNTWNGCATCICRCDCGTEHATQAGHLRSGETRSCGCLRRETAAATGRATRATKITHGHARRGAWHPLYVTWATMIQRCENPNVEYYRLYGGRGIRVCDRWRYDFAAFLTDMGERPPGMTLDRSDNDKGYEPSNCRWATRSEQRRNRRAVGTP